MFNHRRKHRRLKVYYFANSEFSIKPKHNDSVNDSANDNDNDNDNDVVKVCTE